MFCPWFPHRQERGDRQGREDVQSRGNAIAPREVIEKLGVEGYRYYFMTDVTPGTDGAISFGRMEQVYNADLANSWGNLISRSTNMCIKYFEGATPERDPEAAATPRIRWLRLPRVSSSAMPPRWSIRLRGCSQGDHGPDSCRQPLHRGFRALDAGQGSG